MPDLRYGTVAGFAAAAAAANRRRAANARAAAFAVVVVVTLGGTLQVMGRHDASQGLVPATSTPTTTADAWPRPADTAPTASVAPVTPSGDAAAAAGRTGDETAVKGAERAAARTPAGRARTWSTPITSRSYTKHLGCIQIEPDYCFFAGAPVVTDDRVALFATHCTPIERDVTFAEDAEVEFWIERFDSRRTWWRSLTDRPARIAPHTVRLGAGECIEWTTSWFRRGFGGREMPSGRYRMFVRARSPEIVADEKYAHFTLP